MIDSIEIPMADLAIWPGQA